MLNWKNACEGDLKRLEAIKILFGDNEKLATFLFNSKKAELSDTPKNLKYRMGCYSSHEQLLLLIAMDIWGTYGGIHFDDLYTNLSPQLLQQCFQAIVYLKNNP